MKVAGLITAVLAAFVNEAPYDKSAPEINAHDVPNLTTDSPASIRNTSLAQRWVGPEPDPANDELWGKSKCKGAAFIRAFSMTDAQAGALWTPVRASAHSTWTYRTPKCTLNIELTVLTAYYRTIQRSRIHYVAASIRFGSIRRMGHCAHSQRLGLLGRFHRKGGRIQARQVIHGDPWAKDQNGRQIPLDLQRYTRADGKVLRVSSLPLPSLPLVCC
jgi:hypothetical protein